MLPKSAILNPSASWVMLKLYRNNQYSVVKKKESARAREKEREVEMSD